MKEQRGVYVLESRQPSGAWKVGQSHGSTILACIRITWRAY